MAWVSIEAATPSPSGNKGCYTTLVGHHKAKRSSFWHVEGTSYFSSSEITEISSEKALHLRCGESSIILGPKSIELRSPTISIQGQGSALVCSNGKTDLSATTSLAVRSDRVALKSSEASLALGKNAKIDAPKVKINCMPDPLDEEETPPNPPEPSRIELLDPEGHPVPYERFLLTMQDGSQYSGILDKDGKAELSLDGATDGDIVFPDFARFRTR